MPVEVTLPDGQKFRTDHLDVSVVVELAKECETSWAHVVEAPVLGDGSVMVAVFKKCCDLGGVDIPSPLTAVMVAESFETVDDDRPSEFDEGIPVPTTGDAPATTPADDPATTS